MFHQGHKRNVLPPDNDTYTNGGLVRAIGTFGVALVVLNGMIGAGIVALPDAVEAKAGKLTREKSPMLLLLGSQSLKPPGFEFIADVPARHFIRVRDAQAGLESK